ncbi:MAG: MDR family MFS transporter [Myxococcaceae bacterium]
MATPAAALPAAVPELTRQEKVFTIVGTLLGLLLAALDQTIVATAGPQIQKDLVIEPSLYAWITTSYLVASTVFVPIWGKLSDGLGRKTTLIAGILIFLLGSALCGISHNTLELILFRAIQGVGSASLFTSAFAVVADIFPPSERGKYQGIFGAVFGLSSVVGPLAGGFITDNFGWHWVFFVNLPLGAIALFFIFSRMPPLKRPGATLSLDYLGALTLMVFAVPLLLALSLGRRTINPGETGYLWGSPQILGMFVLSVVGLVAFVLVERRVKDPILDLSLFQNKTFTIGNLAAFASGGAFLGAIVFLPLFMVNVVGLSATNSGLTITPLTMGIVAGNIVSGQLVSRTGRYKPLLLGSLIILNVAFAIMAFTLTADSTQGGVTLKMILVGIGLGPSIPIFTLAIQNAVAPQRIGVATSAATFFRQMGSTIGVAVLGTVFGASLTSAMESKIGEATKDVPAEFRSQFAAPKPGAPKEEGASGTGSFDAPKIKQKIADGFAQQKILIVKALRDDDPAAKKALMESPRTDPRIKQAIEAGGIRAQVKAGFDQMLKGVRAALDQGAPGLQSLQQNPKLPEKMRAGLQQIPPEAVATPDGRDAVFANVKEHMEDAEKDAEDQAVSSALAGVDQGLDSAQKLANTTVDKVGVAMKEAFTESIRQIYLYSIFIAVLAFLITLLLPELPLRKTNAAAPPVME